MKACYIVLVYNELDYTFKTFESIKRQKQDLYPFDIICIDNNSKPEIAEKLKSFCEKSHIRYIFHNENNGYAGGNNYAWRIVRNEEYDYVFIANNDIELLNTDISEEILKILEKEQNIALIGTHLIDGNNVSITYSKLHEQVMKMNKFNRFKTDLFQPVVTVVGCFFCIRVKYAPLELFDKSFFMYSEEQNLEYYLMKQGYGVGILNNKNYVVKHYGGFFDFNKASNWKIYLNIRNAILTSKNFNRMIQIKYITLYLMLVIKLFLKYRKSAIIKGFFNGLIYLNKDKSIIYENAIAQLNKI